MKEAVSNMGVSPNRYVSDRERRSDLGQFLTPRPVADFLSSLFAVGSEPVSLLDAGAGAGALTAAFVRTLCVARRKPVSLSVTAYEIDAHVLPALRKTLEECESVCRDAGISFTSRIREEDFIASAVSIVRRDLFAPDAPHYNAAIANPPYRKIRSDSDTRRLLASVGIETSNLYTGFISLIVHLLADKSQLVAITPRSFCNGPYFKPFREDFLASMSLRRLHVFESRAAAFSTDNVLQENVIFHAVKTAKKPHSIVISSSSGKPNAPVTTQEVLYEDVVRPADPEQFIHLCMDDRQVAARSAMDSLDATLPDLGLTVSTGRVVDFRASRHLRREPEDGAAPLIYPCHFNGGFVEWPRPNSRKPNAIALNAETMELMAPSGAYVLVKRFTSKEERKRVVACVFDPERIPSPYVGFENHLNYFHAEGRGMPPNIAWGLAGFLNSSHVDTYFRQFSGHTQVNATDLRSLKYPPLGKLEELGNRLQKTDLTQPELDLLVGGIVFDGTK